MDESRRIFPRINKLLYSAPRLTPLSPEEEQFQKQYDEMIRLAAAKLVIEFDETPPTLKENEIKVLKFLFNSKENDGIEKAATIASQALGSSKKNAGKTVSRIVNGSDDYYGLARRGYAEVINRKGYRITPAGRNYIAATIES